MTRVIRYAIAAAIALPAVLAIDQLTWRPYRCNLVARDVGLTSEQAQKSRPVVAARIARTNIARLLPCANECPASIELAMLLGANEMMAGRIGDAIRTYNRALQYDRRPELYFHLGVAQLAAGDRESAKRNFLLASYSGMYVDAIEDPLLRDQVIRAMNRRDAELRSRLRR